ncbi:unnamed protein product [Mycena citricolor]|uniref:Orc1-like AAA ATPase domain-containing protein n=1 Tax=Mycena citricolor TaxID=2018698 RepID=A0AAD2GWU4_9AGAR|nr:unnamed protein product [Mycena citricolor]
MKRSLRSPHQPLATHSDNATAFEYTEKTADPIIPKREAAGALFEDRVMKMLARAQSEVDRMKQARLRIERCNALMPRRWAHTALPPPPALFFGRDRELNALVDAVATSTTGSTPSCCLGVVGEAGIGKTTLAQALVHHPRTCALFSDRRYWITAGHATVFAAVDNVIEEGLGPGRALVVIDDYDPARDSDTLLRRLMGLPAVLLLLLSGVSSPHVSCYPSMTLSPLSLENARQLFRAVADLGCDAPGDMVDAVIRPSQGLPRVLVELGQRAQYEPLEFMLMES